MKTQYKLICLCIFVLALFAGYDLYKVYSVESQVFGNVVLSKEEKVYEFAKTYSFIIFDNNLSFIDELPEPYKFNGTRDDYQLLINGYPCLINQVYAGYISGVFSLDFYDIDGQLGASIEITVTVQFFHDKTRIIITTTNENNAISYFNNLMEKYGFTMEVFYTRVVFNG